MTSVKVAAGYAGCRVTDRVKAQLQALPNGPGVYLFRGEEGEVLYVGKAKSLRSRVRSYFQKTGDTRLGSLQLVQRST